MAEGLNNSTSINIRVNRHGSHFSFMALAEFIEFPPVFTQAQLQEIPKVTITKEQAAELIQCAVCLEEFKLNEDEIRKLPCNHMYHDTCIFPWLKTNQSCPACRQPLPNANDNDDYIEEALLQHLDLLSADLLRHTAESRQLPLVTSSDAHTPTEGRQQVEEESSSAPTAPTFNETSAVTETRRRVPRRQAALRARRAIQQIYR